MQLRNRVNYFKTMEVDRQPPTLHNYKKNKLFSSLAELFGNEQGEQIYQQARQNNIKYIEEIEEKGYEIVCIDKQMILKKKQEAQINLENDLFEQYQFEDLFDQNINKYKEQLYYDMFFDKAQEFEISKQGQKQKKNKQNKQKSNLKNRDSTNIGKKNLRNSSRDHSSSFDKKQCSPLQQKSKKSKNKNYLSSLNENISHNKYEQINQTPLISSFDEKSLKYSSDENNCKKLQQSLYESNQTYQLSQQNQLSIQDKDVQISEFGSAKNHIQNKQQTSKSSFTLSDHSLSNEELDIYNDQKNIKTKNLNIKIKDCYGNKKSYSSQTSQNQIQNDNFIYDDQKNQNILSPEYKKKQNPQATQEQKFINSKQLTAFQKILNETEINQNYNSQIKCDKSNKKQQKQQSNQKKKQNKQQSKKQKNNEIYLSDQEKKYFDSQDSKKSLNYLDDLQHKETNEVIQDQSFQIHQNGLQNELNSVQECYSIKNQKDNTKSNLDSFQSQLSEFESLLFQKKNLTRNMYKKLKNSFIQSQNVAPFEYSYIDEKQKESQNIEEEKSQILNIFQPKQSTLKVSSFDDKIQNQEVQRKKRQYKKKKNNGSSLSFDQQNGQINSDCSNKNTSSQDEYGTYNQLSFQNNSINNLKNKKSLSKSQIDSHYEADCFHKSFVSKNQNKLKLPSNQNSEQDLNEKYLSSIQTTSQSSDDNFSDESWTVQQKNKKQSKKKYKTKDNNINQNKNIEKQNKQEAAQVKQKQNKNQKKAAIQNGSKLKLSDNQNDNKLPQVEEAQNEYEIINFDDNLNIFECFDKVFNELQIEFLNKKDQQNEQEIIPITHSPSSLKHGISNQKSNDNEQYSPIKKLNYNRPIPKKLKSKVLRKHPQISLVVRQQNQYKYLIQFKNPLQIFNASKWFQID
ncbi:hypothetical protein ABPG74_019723 [Tetrahymena malaccensis]